MERAQLERWLAEGLSLESIGRRLKKDPSTVAYWVRKFGLAAAHRERHAPRGGIAREDLEKLVTAGLSSRQIAAELGVSQSTVRHWLRRHGLRTNHRARRGNSREAQPGAATIVSGTCPKHGRVELWLRPDGYRRCLRCRSEYVAARRRHIKTALVAEAGGRCVMCGYDRCVAALQFHHRDPASKAFSLAHGGLTRSLAAARAEAAKCVLLCANCHAEVEAGVVTLP